MLGILVTIMIVFLFLNFPLMIPLILGPLIIMFIFNPNVNMDLLMGQLMTGVESPVLLCVPLFIFAADLMTAGRTSERLLDFVGAFIGHIRGGYAVTTAAACSLFGAISGSTQATVVAVGTPMRKRLMEAGYKDSKATALIINASDIALLIPPSIAMIIYALAAGGGVSVADLFIAGIIPGLIIFLTFAVYEVIWAKVKDIPTVPRSTWSERFKSFRKSLLPLGFPIVIVGGIYTGIFTPVEASGISVLYAFILEVLIYRSIPLKRVGSLALSTGLVTSVVFILVAGGQLFTWVLGYARIPQQITEAVLGNDPSATYVLIMVSIFFFIGCMFVDPIVVILILTPIFVPAAEMAGVDLVHLGIIITFQVALGSATPPFGVDIFTASAVFKKPYLEVIRSTPPYIIMLLLIGVLLIFVPELSTILVN